jgi:hypothetical protein
MRAQSQYLRIYDNGGTTYQRWQSYYANTSVTWQSQQWLYVPFIADGITSGVSGDETGITITTAATSMVVDTFNAAMREGRLVQLNIYQFDASTNNDTPQASQELIAAFVGQVIGGSATLTTMTIALGTALSPIGAQIPPRVFTPSIMGQGVTG